MLVIILISSTTMKYTSLQDKAKEKNKTYKACPVVITGMNIEWANSEMTDIIEKPLFQGGIRICGSQRWMKYLAGIQSGNMRD